MAVELDTPMSLTADDLSMIERTVAASQDEQDALLPGDAATRQPVHTVYGGAHIFKAGTAAALGAAARATLAEHATNAEALARVFDWNDASLAERVYERVQRKLEREPVEDFRIDFEDGYGNRPDEEEDADAVRVAGELARGAAEGTLPPFVGIRIKPLTRELHARSLRTLDLVVSSLVRSGGLPANFVVTLPKPVLAADVAACAQACDALEHRLGLDPRTLQLELMVETPQSIIAPDGRVGLPELVRAADGRCRAAHFGTYDYTASCSITAQHQHMLHPACTFARHVMQVSLAQTGIALSDGATNVIPVGPHRAAAGSELTAAQREENTRVAHDAWRLSYEHVRSSLAHAFYQGWDLHPAHLPVRYAAVYSFFLEGLDQAQERLRLFVEQAARATLLGDVFDDAATGQGLLNYFLRALNCGAIDGADVTATGLTLDEVRSRSFLSIIETRRADGTRS